MKKDESIIPEIFLMGVENKGTGQRIFDSNCTYTVPKNKRTIKMSEFLTITIKGGNYVLQT